MSGTARGGEVRRKVPVHGADYYPLDLTVVKTRSHQLARAGALSVRLGVSTLLSLKMAR